MKGIKRRSSSITRLISFSLLSRYTHSFRIVLLTHTNEQLRPTNTGKLLLQQEKVPGLEFPGMTDVLVWEGRNDNTKISEAVERLCQPVLIWTEAPKVIRTAGLSEPYDNPTYIILDGTWQEAKKMFRQGPDCLRSIPRISLEPSFQSTYKLRANFGYVSRFNPVQLNDSAGVSDDEKPEIPNPASSLLCTAEVGASLLLQHGHPERARILLNELEVFQMTFQSYSTSK